MMKKSDKNNECARPYVADEDLYDGTQKNTVNKRQLFIESDSYLMDLVSRSTDNAIITVHRRQARRSWAMRITGVAVGIAAIFALVFSMMPEQLSRPDEVQDASVAQVSKPLKPITSTVPAPQQPVEAAKEQPQTPMQSAPASKPKHHAATSVKSSAGSKSPIDEFLSNISDEDAEELAYYITPEIPEY